MSITSLSKERMLIRTTNPIRASVLGMLIDGAKKIAKEELREVTDNDLITSAKRQVKETEKAIEMIVKGKGDVSKYENELVILKLFLPKELSEEEIAEHIRGLVFHGHKTKKDLMIALKSIEGMNMGIANKLVQSAGIN